MPWGQEEWHRQELPSKGRKGEPWGDMWQAHPSPTTALPWPHLQANTEAKQDIHKVAGLTPSDQQGLQGKEDRGCPGVTKLHT